jgi:hypothetical protein
MRPILRGESPQAEDFEPYTTALPSLVSRLGNYCSYCERRVQVGLAVEHIQPKSLPNFAHLIGTWSNFLLGCTNCNSTKNNKDVQFHQLLLPDRDNTFAAFDYWQDGSIQISSWAIENGLDEICKQTLKLTGLDKIPKPLMDENEKIVALDRVTQRMQAWSSAQTAQKLLAQTAQSNLIKDLVIELALATGFFSIWMKVFENDLDIRTRLINAFPATKNSGCFDDLGQSLSPHPNQDELEGGGKI